MKKMKKKFILLLFFVVCGNFYSQNKEKYEFYGAIKLNGSDKEVISYKIVFEINNGNINGYSITDLGGEHETKNSILGEYNSKSNLFSFKETNIIYTKSKINKNSFCYVNYKGKVNLKQSTPKINDNFEGFFENKTKCIDGILQLVGNKKILKFVNKIQKKITKSKKIDENTKERYSPIKLLDSINKNALRSNQNLNIFTKYDEIDIEIYDAEVEDGDMIDLYVNEERKVEKLIVKNKPKVIHLKLENKTTTLKIKALNEGEAAPNTADIIIKDKNNEVKTFSKLKTSQTTIITIIKE